MKQWNKKELTILEKDFSKVRNIDIAQKLNRSCESIRKKAKRLCLKKEYHSKNKKEYHLFKKTKGIVSIKDLINAYSKNDQKIAFDYFNVNKLREEGNSIKRISSSLDLTSGQVTNHLYKQSSKALRCVRYLIKNKFLPFNIRNNNKTKIVLRLLASSFCDSHIDAYFHSYTFAGKKKEVYQFYKEIKGEFPFLNLKVKKYQTNGILNNRPIKGITYVICIQNSYFCRFLFCLGAPIGNKVFQPLNLPPIIKYLPRNLKATFIGQMYSDEGTKLIHYPNKNGNLCFKMSKVNEFRDQHIDFLEEIRMIFSEFNILTSKISIHKNTYIKSNGSVMLSAYFYISTRRENLINLLNNIPLYHEEKFLSIKWAINKLPTKTSFSHFIFFNTFN